MTQTYHANGKLLISGEYFILDGAVGLALPAKFGQTLTVSDITENEIHWNSLDIKNNIWFHLKLSKTIEIIDTSDIKMAETIIKSIVEIKKLNKTIDFVGFLFETKLQFPQNWGLGSSSTLISLLAQFAQIDPYLLLEKTFGGSGYDIACATAKQAITFQKISNLKSQISNPIDYHPSFSNHLYFVHLNQKQNSRDGIQHYKNLKIDKTDWIEQISELTQKIIHAIELDEFCYYLEVHENIIANSLQLQKVKDIYFSDFPGTIKSLGAWGGDFVLVASDESTEKIQQYFKQKGFSTILSYKEMIL